MLIVNEEYRKLIVDILDNEQFNKLRNIDHHGTNRLDHSIRVSYYSYKVGKLLHLKYCEIARAGLLHDFFISSNDRKLKERLLSVFVHPKYALQTSEKYYDLTDIEKDIIVSHMFPLYKSVPKYAESWIVSIVDKVIGINEFLRFFNRKLVYARNFMFIFLIQLFF